MIRRVRAPVAGFTLIELMVTVMVVGILMALAEPSFRAYVQNNRLSGQASSLVYSLSYARSEAIKRNKTQGIEVCVSASGAACSGTTWPTGSNGWIVLDPVAPQVLQLVPSLSSNNTASGTVSPITFNPDGTASAASIYVFCDSRGTTYARDVEVNNLGRIQASQTPGFMVSGAAIAGC
jgi:type IV fimbrial biogenesis protein FimT